MSLQITHKPCSERSLVVLLHMLKTRRPAYSKTERRFVTNFIAPLGTTADEYGNHYLRIGDVPVLWSCHTDTVHRRGGSQHLKQVGATKIGLHPSSKTGCLGADDTAGIWLMREMIFAKVPGLYVFHRCEEIGGLGSQWIEKHNPKLVEGIKFAIALDRKGQSDVITHQRGRCCSDDFADSLGSQLGNYTKAYGVFTDTANYKGLIGECTNISVGYENAHSSKELLDIVYLRNLRDKLVSLDISKLVSKRKPGEVEKFNWQSEQDWWGFGDYGYYGRSYQYPDFPENTKYDKRGNRVQTDPARKLEELIKNHPDVMADLMIDSGINPDDIEKEILHRNGFVRTYRWQTHKKSGRQGYFF